MDNKKTDNRIVAVLLGVAFLGISSTVFAGSPRDTPPPSGGSVFADLPTASSDELDGSRGGDGNLVIVGSEQNMSSKVKDASFTAGTISNGEINVGDNAFAGASGVGINLLNTGNSNAFSTGITTIINLQ